MLNWHERKTKEELRGYVTTRPCVLWIEKLKNRTGRWQPLLVSNNPSELCLDKKRPLIRSNFFVLYHYSMPEVFLWRNTPFTIQLGYSPHRKIHFHVGNQLTGSVTVGLLLTSSLSVISRVWYHFPCLYLLSGFRLNAVPNIINNGGPIITNITLIGCPIEFDLFLNSESDYPGLTPSHTSHSTRLTRGNSSLSSSQKCWAPLLLNYWSKNWFGGYDCWYRVMTSLLLVCT